MAFRPSKLLAFAYWQLRRFFKFTLYDDGYSDWKAMATLCVVQLLLGLVALTLISKYVGYRLLTYEGSSELPSAILITGVVVGGNYYVLRFENRWARLEVEFESYSKLTRVLGGLAVGVAIVFALVMSVITKGVWNALPGSP